MSATDAGQALLNSVIPFTLIAWAERSVEAGLATILNSASPVLAFIGTWLISRHERVSARKLFGVAAGLAGICLVVGVSVFDGAFDDLGNHLIPQLAIIVATICYAGAAIYGRSFKGQPAVVPAAGSLNHAVNFTAAYRSTMVAETTAPATRPAATANNLRAITKTISWALAGVFDRKAAASRWRNRCHCLLLRVRPVPH